MNDPKLGGRAAQQPLAHEEVRKQDVTKVVRFAHMSTGRPFSRNLVARPESVNRGWAWGDGQGRGVRVCIIDSGVDRSIESLGLVNCFTVQESGAQTAVRPDEAGDVAGHGSACAFILKRMAPLVSITSVRVLGAGLKCSSEVLLAALRWAVDARFDVINLSLSTTRTMFKQDFHDLVDEADFQGMSIVASAHNRPVQSYPWTFGSVFSVGAHVVSNPEWLEVNDQPPVEFFGAGVRVAIPRAGTIGYGSGNSFATPHVAAMVARIHGRHPHLPNGEVKHVLRCVADNLAGESAVGRNHEASGS
jgi:subtilisin